MSPKQLGFFLPSISNPSNLFPSSQIPLESYCDLGGVVLPFQDAMSLSSSVWYGERKWKAMSGCGFRLASDYASVLGSDFFHKFPLLLNSAAMFFWKLHEFRSSSVLVEGSRSLSELESESEVETSEDKG
ncbi:hypothetical protein V6N11_067619 [Hibiscus sabdariffa]|uniref:Uncharacterized protein n=1 Tax=Hibiscus sabdariffa TaxID=183260 RepID=A0ABR2SRA6_9ROSI